MSESKIKNLSLDEVEKIAFPSHEISLFELRKFIYRIFWNERPRSKDEDSVRILKHLIDCTHCQKEVKIFMAIDPILNE